MPNIFPIIETFGDPAAEPAILAIAGGETATSGGDGGAPSPDADPAPPDDRAEADAGPAPPDGGGAAVARGRAAPSADEKLRKKAVAGRIALRKKAVAGRIADEMARCAPLPRGWLARKLREDPECVAHDVRRYDVRNEEHRRKRTHEDMVSADRRRLLHFGGSGLPTVTEEKEQGRSADGSTGEEQRGTKKARDFEKSEAATERTLDVPLKLPATSNISNIGGQQNEKGKDLASSESGGENAGASVPEQGKATKPAAVGRKRLPRRRKKFGSGEDKPPEYLEAWKRLDRATAGRGALQTAVDTHQRRLEELRRQLEEAQGGLDAAAGLLRDYDATVVQPAEERIVEVEMTMDRTWMTKYRQLVAYKAEHGGSLKSLPSRCPADRELDSLCTWVSRQRKRGNAARKGTIKVRKPYELQLLEELGFEWDMKDKFDGHLAGLAAFKSHHGHCLVPQKHPPDPKLANWVTFLRQEMLLSKRDGKKATHALTPARVAQLDALGFVWSVYELKWNKLYDRLRGFRDRHGHCRVPGGHPPDPELAAWVARQRWEYLLYQDPAGSKKNRKCKLLPEKIDKLNSLGFDWIGAGEPSALLEIDRGEEAAVTAATEAAEAGLVAMAANPSASDSGAEEAAAASL